MTGSLYKTDESINTIADVCKIEEFMIGEWLILKNEWGGVILHLYNYVTYSFHYKSAIVALEL